MTVGENWEFITFAKKRLALARKSLMKIERFQIKKIPNESQESNESKIYLSIFQNVRTSSNDSTGDLIGTRSKSCY